MMTIPFLLGIALALLIERLHYQPKAIRRAVEAMEDEATRNAARQFEIWKGAWLKNRTLKEDQRDALALALYASRPRIIIEEFQGQQSKNLPDIQFPKKTKP